MKSPKGPRTRWTLRDDQKADTRARLIESARKVFIAQGYARATLDEIARGAGASRATVYLHFPGKVELMQAIIDELLPELSAIYERLDAVLDSESVDRFQSWLSELVDWFEENRPIIPSYDQATASEPNLSTKREDRIIWRLAETMPLYLRRWGPKRADEARLRMTLFVLQLGSVVRTWSRLVRDVGRTRALKTLANIWLSALRP